MKNKTNEQLLEKIGKLNDKIAELEKSETEHKQVEEEILRSKILLESSIESPKDMIILSLDREYRYLYFNKAHADRMIPAYGKRPRLGDCIFDYMTREDDIKNVKAHYDQAMAGDGHTVIDEYGEGKARFYYEVQYNPIYGEKNEIIGITAFARNITERMQVEEALKSSEERLKMFFEFAPDAIYLRDIKGNFLDGNKAAEDLLGYKKEELIGKNLLKLKLLSVKDLPRAAKLLAKSVLGRKSGPEEFIIKHKDGSKVSVQMLSYPVEIKGETVVIGIARNITERKKLEDELRDSEIKYRNLFENSSDFLFILDLKGNFTDVNKTAEVLTGYKKSELLKMNFKDYSPKRNHRKLQDAFYNVYKTGKSIQNFPVEAIIKNKTMKYFETSFSLLRKGEQIIGFHGSSKDITERKQAEKVLQKSKETAERYLDVVAELIITMDAGGNITLLNESGHRLLGYKTGELIGRNWFDTCLPEQMRKELREVFKKLILGDVENVETYENPVLTKNGEERMILWHNTVLRDDEGRITGTLSSGEDITERKQAEKQIKKELEEKTVLLQEVHHRVKNNMQIVSSLLKLQSAHIKDERALELFKNSQNRVKTMALIHDALYRSKDLANIDFAEYVKNLTTQIFISYGAKSNFIRLNIILKMFFWILTWQFPAVLLLTSLSVML